MLEAESAGSLVSGQGAGEIVQANQTDRHVAEDDGDSFHILVRQQALIGALVLGDRFFKSVLTVIDVADVDVQPGKTPLVVKACEYLPGSFRGVERLVIFPEQD